MSYVLRRYIRELILEKKQKPRSRADTRATVKLGTEEKIYDVYVGKDGKITGWPAKLPRNVEELAKKAKKHTNADFTEIVEEIERISSINPGALQRDASNAESMVAALNVEKELWRNVINWKKPGLPGENTGKGEAVFHLAYKSDQVSEPDFVSKDVKLSIKSFMKPSSTVRSGENDPNLTEAIGSFLKTLNLQSFSDISRRGLGTSLNAEVLVRILDEMKEDYYSGGNSSDWERKLKSILDSLNEVKLRTVTEHGAQGTVLVNPGDVSFDLVTDKDFKRIAIFSIRSASRLEFKRPGHTGESLDSALMGYKSQSSPRDEKKEKTSSKPRKKPAIPKSSSAESEPSPTASTPEEISYGP